MAHSAGWDSPLTLKLAFYEHRLPRRPYCFRCTDHLIADCLGLVRVSAFRGVRA